MHIQTMNLPQHRDGVPGTRFWCSFYSYHTSLYGRLDPGPLIRVVGMVGRDCPDPERGTPIRGQSTERDSSGAGAVPDSKVGLRPR